MIMNLLYILRQEVKRLLQVQRATMSSTDSDRESLLEENSALLEHLARLQEAVCSHEIRSAKKQQISCQKRRQNNISNKSKKFCEISSNLKI